MAYGEYYFTDVNDRYSDFIRGAKPGEFTLKGTYNPVREKYVRITENKPELFFTDGTEVVRLEAPFKLTSGVLSSKRNRVLLRALLDYASAELYAAERKEEQARFEAEAKDRKTPTPFPPPW